MTFCSWLALSILALSPLARATVATPQIIHRFGANADGALPDTALIQGADGNFYGTTPMGGAGAVGTIFSTTPAGTFTTLYSFTIEDVNGLNADGAAPTALLQGSDGNFYGTAVAGGTSGCGTIFRYTPGGGLSVLHNFTGSPGDGSAPQTLLQGSDGNFYGTTKTGGANGDGTVFAMTPAGAVTILYSFTGQADGSQPGSLIQGRDGNFYGDTGGGFYRGMQGYVSGNSGTLFRLTPAGVLTIVQTFPGGVGSVIEGTDGNLYVTTGATPDVPSQTHGAVYKVTPAGQAQVLHTFTFANFGSGYLEAPLLQGADGNFYGLKGPGEHEKCGVFQLTPAGAVHILASFGYNQTTFVLSGGANPLGGLIQGRDGNFYGTTQLGGLNNDGVVYSLTPSGITSVLHSFTAVDGQGPNTTLVPGRDGNFYGTTSSQVSGAEGVNGGSGTFFRLSPTGSGTLLYNFPTSDVLNAEGASPTALIAGSDGNFYGTTSFGGKHKSGTLFKLTPAGVLTVLYDFLPIIGGYPSSLLEGSDGNFYVTQIGGDILKVTRAGGATVLHTFTGGADARSPLSLIEGEPGVFYGTTSGTIFKLTATGVFTTLHTFASAIYLPGYTRNGGTAYAGLTLGRDGNLYGTTSTTFFVITPAGAFTALNTFAFPGVPNAALIEGSDGNFYGSAFQAPAYAGGGLLHSAQTAIFQITPQGALNNLYTFSAREGGNDGASMQPPEVVQKYPRGYNAPALVQGPDGNLYGTLAGNYTTNGFPTAADLPETYGAVFRLPLATVASSPLITSTGSAEGVYGQPFNYQITANQAVSSYSASGLPKGLSLNPATGLISGVPVYVGVTYDDGLPNFSYGAIVTVTAQTAAGPATETFLLNLALPVTLTTTTPQVTIGSGQVGKFILSLPNVSGVDLTVNYTITGTAIDGVDYQRLMGTARIYRKTNVIKIIPQGDLGGAARKTVKLTLEPGPGYAVGTTAPAKIELLSPGR